ncbi:hypothetical protein [Nitrospirillum sp. BR 11828]|uniref:hypothetical protein n=1 Tax=Nitrospirillum sp. BR 11828 TaxID=3104325 RepID=UPI002AC9F718|nr:hypothetical protein [Nitrospirillum sp. BR 11828]MDZ5648040.1 hypothetical protein [Nitrospirillum sp. BR 11828]
MLLGHYTIFSRFLFESGYSHYHFSLEDVRHRFCEKVANGRDPTPEVIAEIHQKWESQHGDLQTLIEQMQAFSHANRNTDASHLIPMLIAAIEDTVSP